MDLGCVREWGLVLRMVGDALRLVRIDNDLRRRGGYTGLGCSRANCDLYWEEMRLARAFPQSRCAAS